MNIQTINDVSDCVPLYLPHSLYLKPVAKFKVSVSLPNNKLGKTISNYDIMDKLNSAIKPDKFLVLKVSKSTIEFIRFDGELENIQKLRKVLSGLDGFSFRLNGFSEPFKVRASECRDDFPSRHDWDSFFRDARNMDEMKAGERPDTIHITNLPIRWFCPRHLENDENVKPSENIFKRIFEKFGSVRCVDIPICDLYRSKMKTEITGMKTFSFDNEVMFEGYVQFSEYVGFVKTMDEFRGMKLVKKCGDKNQAVNIIVNFDKTKHLSDASIKRRTIVRDRLMAKERAKQEDEIKKKKEDEAKAERERRRQEELKLQELEKQHEREEKRKEKHLKKLQEKGNLEINHKIKMEERKLMIAQRKLESIRILEALFERIKLKEALSNRTNKNKIQIKENNKKLDTIDLRNKLINRYKSAQEEILEKQKCKLAQVKGRTGLLALLKEKNNSRSPSVNSISSDDLSDVLSDSNLSDTQKKKRIKKKKKKNDGSSTDLSLDEEANEEQPVANQYTGMVNSEMIPPEWFQMGFYPYGAHMFPGIASSLRPNSGPINNYNRGFYAYGAHMFPGMSSSIRPNFNNSMNNYKRGRGQGRGGRGRGHYNNNAYNNSHNEDMKDIIRKYELYKYKNKYNDDNYEDNDHYQDDRKRDSRSYSRSRSRSHSKSYRKHSRSRRSRSRRSRSRSSRHRSRRRGRSRSRSRSHSRSRSKSYSKHKSKKLVSTRRSKSISSSSGRSRSRSRSRSRHRRSWSRRSSRSNSKNSKSNGKHSSKRSRDSKSSEKNFLQPEKLVLSAKEIQRSVQQKLQERLESEENAKNIVATENITIKYKAPIKDPFTRDHTKENSVEKRHKNPFSTSRSRSRSESKSRRRESFNRNNRKDSISPAKTSPPAKKESSKKNLSPCSTTSSTRTRSEARSETPENMMTN